MIYEAVRVERIDRHDLGKHMVELNEDGCARGHRLQEIELGPRPANIDSLENWILPVGDLVDLYHRISMTSRVISREFAKRTLYLPLPREHVP